MRRFFYFALVVLGFGLLTFRWRQWEGEIRGIANSLVALALTYSGFAVVMRGLGWLVSSLGYPELGHSIGFAPWIQAVAGALGLVVAVYVRLRGMKTPAAR